MRISVMKRISASVPDIVYERLEKLANLEGRSFSNLVAHLLERNLEQKLSDYIVAGENKPEV